MPSDTSNYITIPFGLVQPVFMFGLASMILLLCAIIYVAVEHLCVRCATHEGERNLEAGSLLDYDSEYEMDGKTVFGDSDDGDYDYDYDYDYDGDDDDDDDEDGFEMQPLH